MIKRLLKRIFPTAFLKRCFLLYNRIRISTVDRLLFREVRIKKEQFTLYRTEYPFQVNHVSVQELQGTPAYSYMKEWITWSQEEYLLEFNKPCWIEPEYGWAILPPNHLVYESIAFSRTTHQRKPDLLKFWRRQRTRPFPKVVSLRDTGEENYFHFFNDILSKIFFLRESKVAVDELPLIISGKLWDKPYFQYYFSRSPFLQSLHWIVQRDQYIHCDSVIFCKPLTHRRGLWEELVASVQIDVSAKGSRKIFLTRQKTRLRFIENSDEIETACREHGYEIVDADTLSPDQQVRLFSSVSHLVGIHGAGLTNMIFCPPGCRVLELFPPPDLGYLPYHYILLAKIRRFRYRALIGGIPAVRFSGGFRLDPVEFTQSLMDMDS